MKPAMRQVVAWVVLFCGAAVAEAVLPVESGDDVGTNRHHVVVPPPRDTKKESSRPKESRTSETTPDEGVARVILELEDGSRLIGTTPIEKISIRTSYAQMEIALRLIGEITFNKDDASVTVRMQNGDNLKGTLNLPAFKLNTSFGAVSAPIEKVTRISITKGEGASPGK